MGGSWRGRGRCRSRSWMRTSIPDGREVGERESGGSCRQTRTIIIRSMIVPSSSAQMEYTCSRAGRPCGPSRDRRQDGVRLHAVGAGAKCRRGRRRRPSCFTGGSVPSGPSGDPQARSRATLQARPCAGACRARLGVHQPRRVFPLLDQARVRRLGRLVRSLACWYVSDDLLAVQGPSCGRTSPAPAAS